LLIYEYNTQWFCVLFIYHQFIQTIEIQQQRGSVVKTENSEIGFDLNWHTKS